MFKVYHVSHMRDKMEHLLYAGWPLGNMEVSYARYDAQTIL
jgi:hypothetical protein